jgi:hypothetical protein
LSKFDGDGNAVGEEERPFLGVSPPCLRQRVWNVEGVSRFSRDTGESESPERERKGEKPVHGFH